MPHGQSWLSYVPGYHALEHWVEGYGPAWLFHGPVHVQHLAAILLTALIMLLLSLRARGQLAAAGSDILPDKTLTARNVIELMMDGILTIMQFTMPYQAALRHFWIVGTLAFFILFSNLLGLVPGFLPPTENYNTTFACGTLVFLYYNFQGFKRLGLGHIAHMANPVGEPWGWFLAPLFLPVEIISHCIRPVSLSIRLLCNIAGDHLVMGVFVGIFPLILPLPFLALGLFVAVIQVFIFTLLSCVYIGEVEAMVEHHNAHHAHGPDQEAHHHSQGHLHADPHVAGASIHD
ncbi:F0F1 ATP synthase subunit A [Myxococcota bacterium]|nr:F0F1 ATP synthase subunit A [Myxococcota bacterium]